MILIVEETAHSPLKCIGAVSRDASEQVRKDQLNRRRRRWCLRLEEL